MTLSAAAVMAPPPAPAAPVRRKVNFSADSLFDFDKDVIKPAGWQALDAFAAELRGTRFETITVVGHTDRIGSHDYNLRLSARRADAVKDYLVVTAGIPAGKVTARGVNSDEPVTKPDECQGQKRTPRLIACLRIGESRWKSRVAARMPRPRATSRSTQARVRGPAVPRA